MKRRSWNLANLWMIAISCLLTAPAIAQMPQKRALLIGIDDYAVVRDLHGTGNDVTLMHGLLTNRFAFPESGIKELRNLAATRAAILTAIDEHLVEPSEPGDIVVIYVSAHGSQMRDAPNGDELDGWDETIVPHDARTPDVYDITDDELNAALARLAERTNNVTAIFDTCHSGTVSRASVVRGIERDLRVRGAPIAEARAAAEAGLADVLPLGSNFVMISGSRADEFSNEDRFDGRQHGALTYYLVKALQATSDNTYRAAFPAVAASVTDLFPSQHPQIEGSGLDSFVFGEARPPSEPFVLVEPIDSRHVRIRAGAVYGMAEGISLSIYAPGFGPLASAPRVAVAEITSVDVDQSEARLIEGRDVAPYSRARFDTVAFGQVRRSVWIDTSVPADVRAALNSKIRATPSLELLDDGGDEDAAFFVVVKRADGYAVLGRDRSVRSSLEDDDALAVKKLAEHLHGWARWEALMALSHPATSKPVSATLRTLGSPSGSAVPTEIAHGSRAQLTIKNQSDTALYVNVVNLSDSGRIKVVFPLDANSQQRLAPGASKTLTFIMAVPAGRTQISDTFKVIASTEELDASVFEQGEIRNADDRTALAGFLADWALGKARDADLEVPKDWSTAHASMRVTRTGASIRSPTFALHYDDVPSAESVRAALSSERSICGDDLANAECVKVRSISTKAGIVEVEAAALKGTRSEAGATVTSVGQVFDEAYELRERSGADFVEPLLTVQVPGESIALVGQRGGDEEIFPKAEADAFWSLRYANVMRAWERARTQKGKAEGREAAGVVIAHPDTGYTTHPEMVFAAQPPVLQARGRNYIDNNADAMDPRTEDGVLKHPGHGTASGSVIVSPYGCQLAGKTKCASGTAPGAQLVPLRVHTSVVVFDTANLSKAIFDAAEGRLGPDVKVISIAMGGPASRTLWKAVKSAREHGVLLIAAAGNYVRTVVWPARFDAAIAVAAVNPRCETWPHSSHGSAVDISAPGQGVWRATWHESEADVGMGAGTTFATGTTSGIAALWLGYHQGEPEFESLRANGQLTNVFRALLGQSAWSPAKPASIPDGIECAGAVWRSRDYGPGIVDADALLAAPLPATRASERAIDGVGSEIPLFASLYPATAPDDQAVADYRGVLGAAGHTDDASYETELMYHYANNAALSQAIDRIVAGDRTTVAFASARSALLSQDVSNRLRARLTVAANSE